MVGGDGGENKKFVSRLDSDMREDNPNGLGALVFGRDMSVKSHSRGELKETDCNDCGMS